MKTFEQFNFKPFVNDTIRLLNFKKPTKIQERVIPVPPTLPRSACSVARIAVG